jgi:hypothetical protein
MLHALKLKSMLRKQCFYGFWTKVVQVSGHIIGCPFSAIASGVHACIIRYRNKK